MYMLLLVQHSGMKIGYTIRRKYIYVEPGLSRGPGVEVERVVPEVWYSSRMIGSRSGEVVAELKSKPRGRRGAEVP